MKTQSKLTGSRTVVKFLSWLSFAFIAVACAKENNSASPQGYGYQGCTNCGSIAVGQSFYQSMSADMYNRMQMTLNYSGNINPGYLSQYPQYNGQTASPIISYSGPISAQGTLQITQGFSTPDGCVIPPGSYTLQTVQAGQWNQGVVSALTLQAVGGAANVTVTISQGQVSAKSPNGQTWSEIAPVGRLFANVSFQIMSGYSCRLSTLMQ